MPQHCMVLVSPSLGPILSEGVVASFLSSLGPLSALGLSVCWALGRLISWGIKRLGDTYPEMFFNGFIFFIIPLGGPARPYSQHCSSQGG